MLILISPAKSLDFERKFDCKISSLPKFSQEAEILAAELRKLSTEDLEALQKISKNLAELNFNRWQNFKKNDARQALLAFNGDVYNGIEKERYREEDFEFAQSHLRILSGLYGILRPLDLIKAYRLEMGTGFKKSQFFVKNLYEFWGDKIADEIERDGANEIINLASQEYFSALNLKKLSKRVIHISFKDRKNGILKTIGINSKKMRGLMTNHVILNKVDKVEKLKKFSAMGYIFAAELSNENNWIFVR
jgi:cytoplasmic iron level regulating protein YaaA (DUF328/UPF0246 family)